MIYVKCNHSSFRKVKLKTGKYSVFSLFVTIPQNSPPSLSLHSVNVYTSSISISFIKNLPSTNEIEDGTLQK